MLIQNASDLSDGPLRGRCHPASNFAYTPRSTLTLAFPERYRKK